MSNLNTVRLEADGTTGEVMIYDRIGASWFGDGVEAKPFAEQLKKLGNVKTIRVRVNSPGGDVTEGWPIYNMLKDHPARIEMFVDGLAASMASLIVMAGDEITMAENALMMIHQPRMIAAGTSEELVDAAALLEKIETQGVDAYAARTGIPADEVRAMMKAETWMTGKEAVEKKFATKLSANKAIAASFDSAEFNNCPEWARTLLTATAPLETKETEMANEAATETVETPTVDVKAVSDAAEKAERARGLEITAACNLAKKPELAAKFIEAGASLAKVHEELLKAVCTDNACLSGDNQEQTQDDGNGKYRQEYAAQAAAYKKIGMTEEEYIAGRRIDDGIDQLQPGVK